LAAVGLAAQERFHHRIAVDACHVLVRGTGIFQCQPHELATALDAGPVIQRVVHVDLREEFSAASRVARKAGVRTAFMPSTTQAKQRRNRLR